MWLGTQVMFASLINQYQLNLVNIYGISLVLSCWMFSICDSYQYNMESLTKIEQMCMKCLSEHFNWTQIKSVCFQKWKKSKRPVERPRAHLIIFFS